MEKKYIEILFIDGLYGINLENNRGLDDLVYDMKLNGYIDDCYKVVSISDLREQFADSVLKVSHDCGYKGELF